MQREVVRLLDELAPERTNARSTPVAGEIKQSRTPEGCVLQAETAAISVTWYAEADDQDRVGELQILLWSGVVARRGTAPGKNAAQVIRQEVLNPIEQPVDGSVWRSREGVVYTTPALAAYCLSLLEQQSNATTPARQ
jgi:hypothetical protein